MESESFDSDLYGLHHKEMRQVLRQKAHDLFKLCDKEIKGFASKRDMYRLQNELPLSLEQLEEVFDTLDKDNNGCLTLEEFTEGLGMFLGIDSCHTIPDQENNEISTLQNSKEENEEKFEDFLDQLGAHNVFQDEDYIKDMWVKVQNNDSTMLRNFEDFLGKITQEIKATKCEYNSLETTLKNRSDLHDEQVQVLYTEMEEQLKAEKELLLAKERIKEQKIRDELEMELTVKDQQLQDFIVQHTELEKQLQALNADDSVKKHENIKLQKERDTLELRLDSSEKMLKDMQSHLEVLRKKTLEERRTRAKAVLKVSEGVALEREDLVNQLHELKRVNKQLLDEKDELVNSAISTPTNGSCVNSSDSSDMERNPPLRSSLRRSKRSSKRSPRMSRQPIQANVQVMSPNLPLKKTEAKQTTDYLLASKSPKLPLKEIEAEQTTDYLLASKSPKLPLKEIEAKQTTDHPLTSPNISSNEDSPFTNDASSQIFTPYTNLGFLKSDEFEVDENFFKNFPRVENLHDNEQRLLQNNLNLVGNLENAEHHVAYSNNLSKEGLHNIQNPPITDNINRANQKPDVIEGTQIKRSPKSPRKIRNNTMDQKEHQGHLAPERMYKVVFLGDSGVGKSSFIHRFCYNVFKSSFSATIGVDFQVKAVTIDGKFIALQLWDTAGQERFRSLTVQYFRKADGIVVVYDVTSEISFKNVRNWMNQVKEGADEQAVVMLIGNKVDLCESDEDRVIKTKDGIRLADEYGTLFYETSAKNGNSIEESLRALSSLLTEKEDEALAQTLKLSEEIKNKKRKCC